MASGAVDDNDQDDDVIMPCGPQLTIRKHLPNSRLAALHPKNRGIVNWFLHQLLRA
jgi:hypothetical protein